MQRGALAQDTTAAKMGPDHPPNEDQVRNQCGGEQQSNLQLVTGEG
jgi:hypothetical protein